MAAHLYPATVRRVGIGFAVLLVLLVVALILGFRVGTGCVWAPRAVLALAAAACLTGLGLACLAARARARAMRHHAKVAERLDRVFQSLDATQA